MGENLFMFLKEAIKGMGLYIAPIVALGVSMVSLYKSSKVTKMENKLKEYDLRLKEYEIEKIEREKLEKKKEMELKSRPDVKARIYKVSNSRYKIKVYNCGGGTAYSVDYSIPIEYNVLCMKRLTPFEILKPECNFEEDVIIHNGSSKKYKVIISWKDSEGNEFGSEIFESW